MSKSVSIDQSHSVIQALANNVDWSVLDGDVLQEEIIKNQKEAGRQFTTFLKNGGKVIIVDSPRTISINRSTPFNPKTFIGEGWSIEEQDDRAITLTEVDFTKVILDKILEKGERNIKGEHKLFRLKRKVSRIRLDAGIFKTLWEDQTLIPEIWKEKTGGDKTFIFFDGTILRAPGGDRHVLFLCWAGGCWRWDTRWLENYWEYDSPSAVLANGTLVYETKIP